MVVEINYARAVELIEAEIAKESPDFVYGKLSCSNVEYKDGELVGSCLISRAILTATDLAPETIVKNSNTFSGIWSLARAYLDYFKMTAKALSLMESVQSQQDSRYPWGAALEHGIQYTNYNEFDDTKYVANYDDF
jgi:hypothetical protein